MVLQSMRTILQGEDGQPREEVFAITDYERPEKGRKCTQRAKGGMTESDREGLSERRESERDIQSEHTVKERGREGRLCLWLLTTSVSE